MRGRNHRGGNGQGGGGGGGGGGGQIRQQGGNIPLNRNHVFDSSGPDLRIRGTAQQLFEKYLQLGRDASSGGDRVMAESYFQYAEHYFRILNAMAQAVQQGQPVQGGGQQQRPQRMHENNGPEQSGGSQNDGDGDDQEQAQALVTSHHSGGAHQQGGDGRGRHQDSYQQPAQQPAGLGDQPGGEVRAIPISGTPPNA